VMSSTDRGGRCVNGTAGDCRRLCFQSTELFAQATLETPLARVFA
jgi:hypothetical protein